MAIFVDYDGDVYSAGDSGEYHIMIQDIPEVKKVGRTNKRDIILTINNDIIMYSEFETTQTLRGYVDFACSLDSIALIDENNILWNITDRSQTPTTNLYNMGNYIEYCRHSNAILDNDSIIWDITFENKQKLFEDAKHIRHHMILDLDNNLWVDSNKYKNFGMKLGNEHSQFGKYSIVRDIPPIISVDCGYGFTSLLGLNGQVIVYNLPKLPSNQVIMHNNAMQIPKLPEITQIYANDFTNFFLDINGDVYTMDCCSFKSELDEDEDILTNNCILQKINKLKNIALLPEHTKLQTYCKRDRL
jgi:hypothetical protein